MRLTYRGWPGALLVGALSLAAACSTEGSGSTGGEGGVGGASTSTVGAGHGGGSGAAGSCAASAAVPANAPDAVVFGPSATVATMAGGATPGATDGPAGTAQMANPVSVIVEPEGTLLVCDFDNNRIRRVDASGTITTLTAQPNFQHPFGMVFAADGTLYVDTDYDAKGAKNTTSGTVWRVDRATGVATVAGADLGRPRGLAGLSDGRIVLADYQNARVRLLDAGTGTATNLAGNPDCPGLLDGDGAAAQLSSPYAAAVLPNGGVLVADYGNHVLRLVTTNGHVTTYAGDGAAGTVDGPRAQSRFSGPKGLAIDKAGNVYVSDADAHRIRRVGADGNVTTIAGDGTIGFADGPGPSAEFDGQEGIALSADGRTLYVADGTGGVEGAPFNRIRVITLSR
jgi:sugar lactone lactonase YvrE